MNGIFLRGYYVNYSVFFVRELEIKYFSWIMVFF